MARTLSPTLSAGSMARRLASTQKCTEAPTYDIAHRVWQGVGAGVPGPYVGDHGTQQGDGHRPPHRVRPRAVGGGADRTGRGRGPPGPGDRSRPAWPRLFPVRGRWPNWSADGPTRSELFPRLARRIGVRASRCSETVGSSGSRPYSMIEALAEQWPALVLRLPATGGPWPWPMVPVVPLLPGILQPGGGEPRSGRRVDLPP